MSKPHDKQIRPADPGQTKTMFATEGIPEVSLIVQEPSGRKRVEMWFPHPMHAFEWCLQNRCNFVWVPAAPVRSGIKPL
jgi:hypothetical protein